MAARLVRGACPHDCPDTCAMHVTVEDGRATKVAGDPDHPITVGFLCGKVSNYLDRVYSDERILHPLVREGGGFRRASWDEALDVAAAGIERAREGFGGESILPYSYMGTQGLIQGNTMSARVMNALGASALERTICATAGITGMAQAHGVSPEVDPEEWPNARYLLIWGWNPMSTAPHLWLKLLHAQQGGGTARGRRPVPQPHRPAGRRAPAAAARDGRRAGHRHDARGRGRRPPRRGLVPRPRRRLRRAAGRGSTARASRSAPRECGVDAEAIARVGRDFASTRPALLRLGVGAQRHAGAPAAYATVASLPMLTGAWRDRGGGCSYIPTATAAAISARPLQREDLRPGPVRTINMSRLGEALTDPALDPPVKALVCWNSNPAAIAPDQERVLEGLRRDDLFVVVLEQFMTDTAQTADVILPATTQLEHLDVLFSWGHHYVTWNEPAIEPLGEARPNTEIFRYLAERLGLDDPCFRESDGELVDQLLAGFEENGLRERGWTKVDLGQGPLPHAEGGFGTESGRAMMQARYEPPAEVADAALAERFPLALVTPKTHLFLNSTFANGTARQHSAQPSPEVVVSPADAAARGIEDGVEVRVFNERGSFTCAARVSDDARPGVLVAPMGWWNADYPGGRSAQATTPELLTAEGNAPTFNDNRVEVAPA